VTGSPDTPERAGDPESGGGVRRPAAPSEEAPGIPPGTETPAGAGCVVREVSDPAAVTPELVESVSRLVPQLSSSSPPPRTAELAEIVSSPATVLLVAEDGDGRLLGMLTLAVFRLPTGLRAWIEDVVVDELARGRGAGEALVKAAIDRAGTAGARSVDLTSRPSRVAANRLYRRLGFEERQTNVYRWSGGAGGAGGVGGSGARDDPENGAGRPG